MVFPLELDRFIPEVLALLAKGTLIAVPPTTKPHDLHNTVEERVRM